MSAAMRASVGVPPLVQPVACGGLGDPADHVAAYMAFFDTLERMQAYRTDTVAVPVDGDASA